MLYPTVKVTKLPLVRTGGGFTLYPPPPISPWRVPFKFELWHGLLSSVICHGLLIYSQSPSSRRCSYIPPEWVSQPSTYIQSIFLFTSLDPSHAERSPGNCLTQTAVPRIQNGPSVNNAVPLCSSWTGVHPRQR